MTFSHALLFLTSLLCQLACANSTSSALLAVLASLSGTAARSTAGLKVRGTSTLGTKQRLGGRLSKTTREDQEEESETQDGVFSGDAVHLFAADGRRIDEKDGHMVGTTAEDRGIPGIIIDLDGGKEAAGAEIRSGDSVFLRVRQTSKVITPAGRVTSSAQRKGHLIRIRRADGKDEPITSADPVFFYGQDGHALYVQADGKLGLLDRTPKLEHSFTVQLLSFGALHDIVGQDGVFMISLQKPSTRQRRENSLSALGASNVFPVGFPATDARKAPQDALDLACPWESQGTANWCAQMGRSGTGCKSKLEQAMTDSHRRALVAAMLRTDEAEWTAIIEDDAVPVPPQKGDWSEAFRQQWAQVPKEALIVRLGTCSFESEVGAVGEEPLAAKGDFQLVQKRWWSDATGKQHYYTGGCTTGYIIHKSIIPTLLQMFPCCCSFDCCLERQLFYAETAHSNNATDGDFGRWWGAHHLVDMQHVGARKFSADFADFNQSGILVQDHRYDDVGNDDEGNGS